MSTRLTKVVADLTKQEQILKKTQDKIKALQREKLDLENLEMVDFLRKHKIHAGELKTIVDMLHDEKGTSLPLKTEITEVETHEKV